VTATETSRTTEQRAGVSSSASRVAPNTVIGAAFGTFALATIVGAVAVSTQDASADAIALALALALALVFATPVFLLLRNGHFGRGRWRLPTPAGFAFVMWQAGLAPSMVAISTDVKQFAHASDDAILCARVVFFAWFLVLAIAIGGAPEPKVDESAHAKPNDGSTLKISSWLALLVAWAVSGAIAASYDMVSNYAANATGGPVAGSGASAALLFYHTLAPVMAPAALLMFLRGPKAFRFANGGIFLVALALLFVVSQRRLWFAAFYLCFVVAERSVKTIPIRWVVIGAIVAIMGGGPLTWAFRGEQHSSESTFKNALNAVTHFATDESKRADAYEWGETNMRDRLGISGVYFAATDLMLEYGPNWSPTPLQGLVLSIPKKLWETKNDVALRLSPNQHLADTGRFPPIDLSVSPIAEFTFEFGQWLAPLGALAYAFLGRWLSALTPRAMRSLPVCLLWASLTVNLAIFDGGTVEIVASVRDLVALVILMLVAGLVERKSSGAIRARQVRA
jgi:hypothetical protein